MNIRAFTQTSSAWLKNTGISVWGTVRNHPWKSLGVVCVLAVGAYLLSSHNGAPLEPAVEDSVPLVTLARIGDLGSGGDALTTLGEVRSVSQAELRAQKSGKITRVYVKPGTSVTAGTLLAEIDATGERAAVLGAQGTLAAAEAQYAKLVTGARSEDRASVSASADSAAIALLAAEDGARAAYSQAYGLAADALFAQADDFFTDVYTVNPSFRVMSASYGERQTVESERVALGKSMASWKERTETASAPTELDALLVDAERMLDRMKQFLNTISMYVSQRETSDDYTAADKAVDEAVLLGARGSIDAGKNAVLGARQNLAAARSARIAARGNESKVATGERAEDIRIAEASITQARAALLSAQALLENALIRAPIHGTVTTLNVSAGDFVSNFESVAVVANPSALEVVGFVSASTRDRLMVGAPVLVDGVYAGTTTTLAPGLDPDTKKARFTVGLADNVQLTNGQSVKVTFSGTTTEDVVREYALPLSAIKVLPNGFAIFTVRDDGTLEAHPIAEGAIVGDRMLLTDNLSPRMLIVTDVRGLRENERVEVAH